ncbi:alpha/beta hydrolase [Ilumatobacter nonamiensis]|uniref:alpha/beta hydrolase n=1 Tax=Ilumatobacter nonamiensis TaxID=467093 RepID=UPI00034A325E|nr:alpha/beta hydrolase [Ilumatobacter nonamiensis]
MIASTTDIGTTHDGLEQLRRRWTPESPRAAMLLVHGIGEHSGRYEHVGAAFAEAGVDVLSFDQRGFGETAGRRAHVETFDEFLVDVQDLLDDRRSLRVPVILMGHSLGGLVVTAYLVSDRPLPDLAVLSAPALSAELPRWQRIAAPVLGRIAPGLNIPVDFDGSVLSRDEAVQTAYENDPLRVPASTAGLGRESLKKMKEVAGKLDRLTVPTYVLHGSDDTLVRPTASEPLAILPNVTRRVWDGLRHECLNEPERDEVIAEIVAWLDAELA